MAARLLQAAARGPRPQAGAVRCCLLLVLLLATAAGALVVGLRVAATPDLGPPPRGPVTGSDRASVAAALAASLAVGLAAGPHATATISEADLTTLARLEANPDHLNDPTVRVRGGLLVIAARTDLGPVSVNAVGRVEPVIVTAAGGTPDIGLRIREIEAGDLTLPGFARDAIARRVQGSFPLDGLLSSQPQLNSMRPLLDCVRVTSDGVELGVHRPDVGAAPDGCG